jgi:hypothetical protein
VFGRNNGFEIFSNVLSSYSSFGSHDLAINTCIVSNSIGDFMSETADNFRQPLFDGLRNRLE